MAPTAVSRLLRASTGLL